MNVPYSPAILVGQWWADCSPTTLMQVMEASGGSGMGEIVVFRTWLARQLSEPPTTVTYVMPNGGRLEYLWYETWLEMPLIYETQLKREDWQFGAARISPDDGRIFFVADTTIGSRISVHVRASWRVGEGQFLNSLPYSPGCEYVTPPSPVPQTSFQKLMEEI